jgi:hypothetical protein
MAIETKDKQISASAPVIKTAVDPNAAQIIAKQAIAKAKDSPPTVELKSSTASRLKTDAPSQQTISGQNKPTDEEISRQRYIQIELLNNKHDLINNSENNFGLTYQDLANKTTLTQNEIFSAGTSDKRVANTQVAERINENGSRTYYVGSGLTDFLSSRSSVKPSGVQAQNSAKDNFRLTSIGDIQREMFDAIELASKVTGVPTKLLGAMAGKESTFGKGQVSSSGAEGLFQQTDGYLIANYVKNPAQAKLIASVVPEAAEYMKDGKITLDEARKLAWNPAAAAMLTALRAQALAKDLNLDLNKPSSWAYVYTEHNAGRGSLNNLLKGGMTEKWIQDLNPSMYKGANSAQDVLQIAANDMEKWGNRFEKLVAASADSSSSLASAAIAKASASSKANLRNPAPEPA